MDRAEGRRVEHPKFRDVLLHNGASISRGRTNDAAKLAGNNQYVDLGAHFDKCLGNIDYCNHGQTVSMWIYPFELKNGDYIFAAPTYSVFYEDGMVNVEYEGKKRSWRVSTSRFKTDAWQRITLAWHPKKGLTVFINDELMGSDRRGVPGSRARPDSEHVIIGKDLVRSSRTDSKFLMDDIQG